MKANRKQTTVKLTASKTEWNYKPQANKSAWFPVSQRISYFGVAILVTTKNTNRLNL